MGPTSWILKREPSRLFIFKTMQFYHALEGKNLNEIVTNLRCTAADVCDCNGEITDCVCGVSTSKMVFELVHSGNLDDELGWLGCDHKYISSVQTCDRLPG